MKHFLQKIIFPTLLYALAIIFLFLYYYLSYGKVILDGYAIAIIIFLYFTFLLLEAIAYFIYRKNIQEGINRKEFANSFLYAEELETTQTLVAKYENSLSKIKESKEFERRLLSSWVHSVKTPVSSIKLIIERMNADTLAFEEGIKAINEQNERIEHDLNQMLDLKRLDEFAKDFYPEKLDLAELVREIVNEEKRNFILHAIYPKITFSSIMVVTDKKWCKEMFKQVISNAIKYSNKDQTVTFSAIVSDNTVTLAISDHGIGIPEYDQKRIFEPFFTGENGRSNHFSSGIGLYLVKKIADSLSVKVDLSSKVNDGTTLSFTFFQNCKIKID